MRKLVELSVEYTNPQSSYIEYAVLFVGFMTRRFMYLQKVSYEHSNIHYIKVAINDTCISDGAQSTADPDEIRSMIVTPDDGLLDSRIKALSEDDSNIALIKEYTQKWSDKLKKHFS